MELRNLRNDAVREMEAARIASFVFLVSGLAFLCAAGCGAPGEPTPPSPPVPVAITDLTAHQALATVERLSFETTDKVR